MKPVVETSVTDRWISGMGLFAVSLALAACPALPFLVPAALEFARNLLNTSSQNYSAQYTSQLERLLVSLSAGHSVLAGYGSQQFTASLSGQPGQMPPGQVAPAYAGPASLPSTPVAPGMPMPGAPMAPGMASPYGAQNPAYPGAAPGYPPANYGAQGGMPGYQATPGYPAQGGYPQTQGSPYGTPPYGSQPGYGSQQYGAQGYGAQPSTSYGSQPYGSQYGQTSPGYGGQGYPSGTPGYPQTQPYPQGQAYPQTQGYPQADPYAAGTPYGGYPTYRGADNPTGQAPITATPSPGTDIQTARGPSPAGFGPLTPPPAGAPDGAPPNSSKPIGLEVAILKQSIVDGRKVVEIVEDGAVFKDGRGTPSAGDKFKLIFRPDADGYVYVISIDGSGWAQGLFPSQNASFANPVKKDEVYILPSENKWYALDQYRGIETLYVVAAYRQRADIEESLRSIADRERPATDKPKEVTEPPVIPQGVGNVAPGQVAKISLESGDAKPVNLTAFYSRLPDEDLRLTRWFKHE